MRRVASSSAVLLSFALSAAGCATTHLSGEYNPDSQVPLNKPHEIQKDRAGNKQTLAKGHDWVFFWGIVELQSTEMAKKIKGKVRNDELVQDMEVRNHISLPGALLWIVTAGIVSHHDVDFRGRIVTAKELPPPAPTPVPAPMPTTTEDSSAMRRTPSESELFADTRIDRPIDEVSRDFDEAAGRAGLTPVARVKWDEVSAARRTEHRGDIPENRLAGVEPSDIRSFSIVDENLAKNVKSDPRMGTRLPCLVCYDEGGKTRCIYSKPTAKLRALESSGQVGDGRFMSRDEYYRRYESASACERSLEKLVESLKTASKSP